MLWCYDDVSTFVVSKWHLVCAVWSTMWYVQVECVSLYHHVQPFFDLDVLFVLIKICHKQNFSSGHTIRPSQKWSGHEEFGMDKQFVQANLKYLESWKAWTNSLSREICPNTWNIHSLDNTKACIGQKKLQKGGQTVRPPNEKWTNSSSTPKKKKGKPHNTFYYLTKWTQHPSKAHTKWTLGIMKM